MLKEDEFPHPGFFMKVSIITVALNNAGYIESCIKSVFDQDYKNIEYIVVDGDSKDGTIDIIKKYENKIANWVSEPDKGIYDAMNKGIGMATGDVIGFLHTDDVYANEKAIETVMKQMNSQNIESCYGDLVYVDREDPEKTVRYWKSCPYGEGLFQKGWMPPHPTFFVHRQVYEKYGIFNLTMGTVADYELMLRFLYKNKISTTYIPEVLVKMRTGGASNISLSNRLKANRMDRLAWKVNGLNPPFLLGIRKPLSKIGQWFSSP